MTRERPSIPFLIDLLRLAVRKQASAVYIVPWMPPTVRIDEQSVPLSQVAFSPEQTALLVRDMLDDAQRAALDRAREVEFSLTVADLGRLRVHAFRRHGQPAMAIRPFSTAVPMPSALALPLQACTAALAPRGLLVLASRSAPLRREAAAALIEHRNHHGQGEIAFVDEATLFWHERARCRVRHGMTSAGVDEWVQRRVARAATAIDGMSPMAVLWGELRDASPLPRMLRSAEHALVVLTLEADSLAQALHRLAALAEEAGAAEMRHRLGLALHAVLSLRPVPAAAGGRELAATEVLMNSPDLAATMAEGERPALADLAAGRGANLAARQSGCGPDEHLWQLVSQGLVTLADATRHAADRAAFELRASAATAPPVAGVAAAPVTVDTEFADVFAASPAPTDPFDFALRRAGRRAHETQFDGVDWNAGSTSQADPLQTLPSAPPERGVQFHAWAPAAVPPGQAVAIDIWAALPGHADTVAELARQAGPPTPEPPTPAEGATLVTLQLRIDGLIPVAPTQRLSWAGRPAHARFDVVLPERVRSGAHAARVKVAVGGLPVGELSFVLQVSADAAPGAAPADAHAARRMLRSAYASYTPVDREQVDQCLAELHLVAPDLEVYLDAPDLRHDDHWRERIERRLARNERLFLFWSSAAAESPWVDFEWRTTMRRRGPSVIDVVLLEPPRVAPLPPELADAASVEVRLRRKARPGTPGR